MVKSIIVSRYFSCSGGRKRANHINYHVSKRWFYCGNGMKGQGRLMGKFPDDFAGYGNNAAHHLRGHS